MFRTWKYYEKALLLFKDSKRFYRVVRSYIIINCQQFQNVNCYMRQHCNWFATKASIQHTLSIHSTTARNIDTVQHNMIVSNIKPNCPSFCFTSCYDSSPRHTPPKVQTPVICKVDTSCIKMLLGDLNHRTSKHIRIKYHHVKEFIKMGELPLVHTLQTR